jgi:hypothetical protein
MSPGPMTNAPGTAQLELIRRYARTLRQLQSEAARQARVRSRAGDEAVRPPAPANQAASRDDASDSLSAAGPA